MGRAGQKETLTLRRVTPSGVDSHRGPYLFVAEDDEACWVSLSSVAVMSSNGELLFPTREEDVLNQKVLAPFKEEGTLVFYSGNIVPMGQPGFPVNLPKRVRNELGIDGDLVRGPSTFVFGDLKDIRGVDVTADNGTQKNEQCLV